MCARSAQSAQCAQCAHGVLSVCTAQVADEVSLVFSCEAYHFLLHMFQFFRWVVGYSPPPGVSIAVDSEQHTHVQYTAVEDIAQQSLQGG